MRKLRTVWEPGSEFLLGTIEYATNLLLYGDRVFGDGKMTENEARELIVLYRKKHKDAN